MPRFFFHVEDGGFNCDREGTELTDDAAARVEAVRLARQLLSARPQALWEENRWRLLVEPSSGPALFGLEIRPVDGRYLTPWQRE